MSRRKQPNPAKLGDAEATINSEVATANNTPADSELLVDGQMCEPQNLHPFVLSVKTELSAEKADNTDDEDARDLDNTNEVAVDTDDLEDSLAGSVGTDPESWGSHTPEQTSPTPSSCPTPSSSLSDVAEADLAFTVGITDTTPYACKICNKAFARSSLLSKHEQSHTEHLQYGCSFCPRLFKHKRSRDRHIKLHTGDKKYKCVHCQTAFSRSDHLKIHMKTHDNSKPFRCLVCNRGYNTAAALTSHQESHTKQNEDDFQKSSESIKCFHCQELFNGFEQLQIHVSSVHNGGLLTHSPTSVASSKQSKWTCMYCNKSFKLVEKMQHHVLSEHNVNGNVENFLGNSPLNNTIESLSMNSINSKDSILNDKQSEESPTYACESCTMHFDSIEKLKVHESCNHWKSPQPSACPTTAKDCNMCNNIDNNLSCDPQNPIQPIQIEPTDLSRKRKNCEFDNEVVTSKQQNNINNVASNFSGISSASQDFTKKEEWTTYICSICGTQLPTFASFMVHMDIHMSIKSTTTNVVLGGYCPLCGEAYRNQSELNNHIVLHTLSYKPGWCCRICKKIFNDNIEDFQRHLIENHTCTTYKCCACEQLFDTKSAMLVHLTKKHSNECQHYRCKFCPDQIFHNQISAEMHISQHVPRLFNSSRKSTSFDNFSFQNDFNNRLGGLLGKNLQCSLCRQCFKNEYHQQIHILKDHKDFLQVHSSKIIEDCGSGLEQISTARSQRDGQTSSPTVSYSNSTSKSENCSRYDNTLIDNCICDACGTTDLNSEAELTTHKKMHHVKSKIGSVSLQCAYCNEHCKSRSELENHMKNHQISSNKGKHKCNICDEIYFSATTLAQHKLSHCKIISGNTCTQCKTVLSDEQLFYTHQLQHSAVINKANSQISLPANCIICCQTLQTDVEIKLHANFHLQHIIQKESLCNTCKKIFDSRTGLVIHSFEKSAENLIISICKECLVKCEDGSPQTIKQENTEKTMYSCIKCSQTFETENEVKKHASTHHAIGENSENECHICRTMFPTPLKLQLHVIEHSFFGTGQFRCYICSSIFTTANGLLSHMLEHGPNAKPYECANCQMKFFFQTELDNHKYEHVFSQAIAQSINSKIDSADFNSKNIKTEHYSKCPYCDMSSLHTYLDVHIEVCSQNPKHKKNIVTSSE